MQNIPLGHAVTGIKIGNVEIVNFLHIRNNGAAFGILSGRQPLLIIVTGLFLLFAIYVLFSDRIKSKMKIFAVTLIIAGGIGNFIDRIQMREVVDFIELGFMDFAIFNFADICAVVGACILFVSVAGEEIREYRVKQACGEVEVEVETECLGTQNLINSEEVAGIETETESGENE